MISKFKDFLDDPFGFLIHHNSIFDFRMLLVAQRCVSTDTLTGSVLCTKRSLYFTAGVLGKPFIEQRLFGKGKDKQAEIQYSCGFAAGWLPKS